MELPASRWLHKVFHAAAAAAAANNNKEARSDLWVFKLNFSVHTWVSVWVLYTRGSILQQSAKKHFATQLKSHPKHFWAVANMTCHQEQPGCCCKQHPANGSCQEILASLAPVNQHRGLEVGGGSGEGEELEGDGVEWDWNKGWKEAVVAVASIPRLGLVPTTFKCVNFYYCGIG